MSDSATTDRKLPITQIDELWALASSRWGDPGRRTPAPDPRFRELREYLGKIEGLFAQDKIKPPQPKESSSGFRPKRKMVRHSDDEFSNFDPDSDEIPF